MAAAVSPIVVAQVVARNAVPLAGVLFLGWRADSVLLLYFLDTMLSIAVIFAGLMSVFARTDPKAARLNPLSMAAAVLLLAAFISVPLGVPVFMVLAANGMQWRDLLNDPGFRTGAVMQAIAAFWSYLELWRALRVATPEQLRIKRRFTLVFLRWIGVIMTMYTGIGIFAPVVMIAAYVALSIWSEIAPDRFLRAAGDLEDAREQVPTASPATTPGPVPPRQALPRKRRHRRS